MAELFVSESLFAVGLLVILMAMVMKSLRPELEVITVIGMANAVGMVGYALVIIVNRFFEGARLERELMKGPTIADLKAEAESLGFGKANRSRSSSFSASNTSSPSSPQRKGTGKGKGKGKGSFGEPAEQDTTDGEDGPGRGSDRGTGRPTELQKKESFIAASSSGAGFRNELTNLIDACGPNGTTVVDKDSLQHILDTYLSQGLDTNSEYLPQSVKEMQRRLSGGEGESQSSRDCQELEFLEHEYVPHGIELTRPSLGQTVEQAMLRSKLETDRARNSEVGSMSEEELRRRGSTKWKLAYSQAALLKYAKPPSDSPEPPDSPGGRTNFDPEHVPSGPETAKLGELLGSLRAWDFDTIMLEKESPSCTLYVVAQWSFRDMDLIRILGLDDDKFKNFMYAAEQAYLVTNAYHTATHAADVLQTLLYFLTKGGIAEHPQVSSEVCMTMLLAAATHDIGHLGVNNAFLKSTKHELALIYNDHSPLENMHISLAFKMLLEPKNNFFRDDAQLKSMRPLFIAVVLGTDNDMHAKHLGDLEKKQEGGGLDLDKDQDLVLFLTNVLHAADVSNPTKPWVIYNKWVERISFEFFATGDKEREAGLDVTPMFDRSKPIPLPKFQLGFIRFIVSPLYHKLAETKLVDFSEPIKTLLSNEAKWVEQDKA